VEELVRAFGPEAWEDFMMFGADLRHYLFPGRAEEGLSQFEKDLMWRCVARAAVNLRAEHDPNELPPPARDAFTAAFTEALVDEDIPGVELNGPAWKMSPDEDLPTREEVARATVGS
jgi:hypothetical protein